jgi:hypothetical protein
MFLIKENKEKIKLKPGYSILTGDIETGKLKKYLVIEQKKKFKYYEKRLNTFVNSGAIKPEIYNTIKKEQTEEKKLYLLNDNYEVNKTEIINILNKYRFTNINIKADTAQILNDLENLGYLLIIKN